MMKIGTSTQVYALIGDPVEHSLSPLIHNLAFQSLKLNCVYLTFHVRIHELDKAIKGIKALGVSGFNVTVPHKVAILSFMDEIRPSASVIGAINTVVNDDGKLVGYNTDGQGALAALLNEGANPKGKRVVLLGAGGAARAIAFTLTPIVDKLIILNRTGSKASILAKQLEKRFRKEVEGKILSSKKLSNELDDTDILINSTSVGMYPNVDESLVDRKMIRSDMTVFDIVYNPLETKLIKEAKASGAKTVGGAKMLVYQGALSFEIWTGKKPPIEKMLKVVIEKLKEA